MSLEDIQFVFWKSIMMSWSEKYLASNPLLASCSIPVFFKVPSLYFNLPNTFPRHCRKPRMSRGSARDEGCGAQHRVQG